MGPPSYTRSVVDRNVIMRHMNVLTAGPRRYLFVPNIRCILTFVRGKRFAKKIKLL